MSDTAPILVIAYGNLSRGDDAVGPQLAARLEAWLAERGEKRIEVLSDFQLNIEHALDFIGRRRVLLMDAKQGGDAPFSCVPVLPVADSSISTHTLSPGALLEIYRSLRWADPPPVELLSIPGSCFELGAALSPEVSEYIESAWVYLKAWCLAAAAKAEVGHA